MASMNSALGGSFFEEMCVLKEASSRRVSSWDRKGHNRDFIVMAPGETAALADIRGAGCIRHIYFTVSCMEIFFLRTLVLRMYWDGERRPSVEVPFGDFFGVPFARMRYFSSLMLTVNPGRHPGGTHGFNCYFPMPFSKRARITLENQSDLAIENVWYHIDFDEYPSLPPEVGRFHAQWRRENPCRAIKYKDPEARINLDGKENYVILEAKGEGNYVGCVLEVDNIHGGWYGEGDDMIFIDGDTWPPRYHGTGTEEIFGGGSCPNREYAGPYHGFHMIESPDFAGKNAMYRFFVHDPVRFKRSIRVTVEHGHANDLGNDYASVAYWCQEEPHAPFPALPSPEERMPRIPPEGVTARAKARELQAFLDQRGGWRGVRESMGEASWKGFAEKASLFREASGEWRFKEAIRHFDEAKRYLAGRFKRTGQGKGRA